MSVGGEHVTKQVSAAAARTVAARTGRLFAAWTSGSPVPDEEDRRCEGLADFAARRARVWQVPFGTAGLAALFLQEHKDADSQLSQLAEPQENIYDGANGYIRVGDNWTGFFLGDPSGPRGVNDPLWPLDALFGAKDDGTEVGADVLRGVATTRYRVTIDLAQADAALQSGVTVPAMPYRVLSQIPAEVWLDAAGRARRISVDADPGEAGEPVWSIVELWDFGVDVDIVPPEPGEVLPPRQAYGRGEVAPAEPKP